MSAQAVYPFSKTQWPSYDIPVEAIYSELPSWSLLAVKICYVQRRLIGSYFRSLVQDMASQHSFAHFLSTFEYTVQSSLSSFAL